MDDMEETRRPDAHVAQERLRNMWTHLIQPVFDSGCHRVFYADRQGAQAHLVAMEVWNRATGRDLGGRRLVVYRCPRCGGFHVAARFAPVRKRRAPEAVAVRDDGPAVESD